MSGKPRRNAKAVDGLNPVEVLGDEAGLVGLKRPDEVPLAGILRMHRTKVHDLLHPFLNVVFPERPLTAGIGLLAGLDGKGLPDGNEPDGARRPARRTLRGRKFTPHPFQSFGQSRLEFAHDAFS